MMMEFERFVEFGPHWWDHHPRRREDLVLAPILLDTDYIYWVYQYPVGPFDFVDVRMVDRPMNVVLTKTYEEMRELLVRVPKKSLFQRVLGY